MARNTYSPETKAAAMSALLEGQSINQVSRTYTLPRSTVSLWKREAKQLTYDGGQNNTGSENARAREVGSLVLEYLCENLRALRTQAMLFGDRVWLERQDASQLAVLHGVQTDKAVRLLEALNPPEPAA